MWCARVRNKGALSRGTFLALHVVGDAAITTRGLSNGSAALPERLRARLARADDGVWVTTNDGRIAFWNRSAETSLGFRAQEVCGRCCADVLTGCDECGRPICGPGCDAGAGVPKGVGRNFGIPTYTKDGRKVWLEVMTFTTNGNESPPFVIHVFHDATRTKQLLRDLREHIDDASEDAERLTPRQLDRGAWTDGGRARHRGDGRPSGGEPRDRQEPRAEHSRQARCPHAAGGRRAREAPSAAVRPCTNCI
jgi:PAS domain S-box-containing protein